VSGPTSFSICRSNWSDTIIRINTDQPEILGKCPVAVSCPQSGFMMLLSDISADKGSELPTPKNLSLPPSFKKTRVIPDTITFSPELDEKL
jgi:hypothetical protein